MFWNNVKALLKNKKITQKQLSVLLDLPERTVETWISRNSIPDAETAVKIAAALETSVEYLVTGTEPDKAAEELKQLKAKLLELSQC